MVCLIPSSVFADVRITEIAWMGTVSSQYSEWFELYNDGATSVNLAGWKLAQGDGSVVFTMTKSIGANEYLLVERTTASAPDAVPGIDDEAGPFGASGFANTGEDLVLEDASGVSVDTLSYASGWPAGDATTKATMQWDGSGWITATASPKAATSGSDEGSGSDSEESEAQTDLEKDPYPIPAVSPNKPHIQFTIPKNVIVGVPISFQGRPVFEYNYVIDQGSFTWNMGDGTLYYQDTYAPLRHIYYFPGTYTISFRYSDPQNNQPTLTGTYKVTVVASTITVSVRDTRAITIKNTSSVMMDLSEWKVRTNSGDRMLPDMTIVAERATIDIPFAILSVVPSEHVSLIDPSGAVAASSDVGDSNQRVVADDIVYDDAPYEAPDLSDAFVANARDRVSSDAPITKNTKTIVFGVIALFVIGLSILLERFMAQQEYRQEK